MTQTLLQYSWFVVAVPFVLAAVIALLGRREGFAAPLLAAVGGAGVLALGVVGLSAAWDRPPVAAPWTSEVVAQGSIPWVSVGDVSLTLGWAVDSLAAIMLCVVGVVGLCVVVFSAGYLTGDRGWGRYFALLSLFSGSMALLVVADSFTTLFIGWELVGACSYLLIGHWYERPAAANAAVKAFLTTRVGDVGLLIGLAILWTSTGTLDYTDVSAAIPAMAPAAVTGAALLLAAGAIGKSAQLPLHAWLPDAMEGPTPVSALIHAATMVAAGVYLIARIWPLFAAAPVAQAVLVVVGAVSALGAAAAATVQLDIKKVLAYSTISQLGFMFVALGAGAWAAAFFHLVTHAAFKGLLFLAAGSAIHGAGTQDLHEMGGLARPMRITFVTWVIGVCALAGLPLTAGFASKEGILGSVWQTAPAAGVVLFAAGVLTAFYSARATRLAFLGPRMAAHAHESAANMRVPLVVLAAVALGLGWFAPAFFEALHTVEQPLSLAVAVTAAVLAVAGGVAGWAVAGTVERDRAFLAGLGWAGGVLSHGYGWDRFVDSAIVRPVVVSCRALWGWGDRFVVDGVVEETARRLRRAGGWLSQLQSGDAQEYATAIALTVTVMLLATIWMGS